MNTRNKIILFLTILISCSPDLSDDPIPSVVFQDIPINLSLPEYNSLNTKGYQYLSEGVRGIIVYRINPTTYYAFERTCSYQPNNACATVDVHSSGLYLTDACCGSTFNSVGEPTGGPAWRPLRKYVTSLSGNILTITDEIIE